jgi:hypothetical protein
MRSTELRGERGGWNLHLMSWVVYQRRFFLEVWIFRNVRHEFENFVAHHVSAAAAIRKNGVAHQDHAGARLVLVAYLIDSRLLNQFSRSQCAIGLVKGCDVSVVLFHGACLCSFLQPPGARAGEQLGYRSWDAFRVATSWCAHAEIRNFAISFQATPGHGCAAALEIQRSHGQPNLISNLNVCIYNHPLCLPRTISFVLPPVL